MNLLRLVAAGAAVAVILAAFRDFENGGWLSPAWGGAAGGRAGETEPILGYDGMDQETLLEWLGDADLDRATLQRMQAYERAHRARQPVLAAIGDLL